MHEGVREMEKRRVHKCNEKKVRRQILNEVTLKLNAGLKKSFVCWLTRDLFWPTGNSRK